MIWESDAKEVQTLCFTPNKSKDLNILIILDLFYLSLYGVGFFSSKKTPKKPHSRRFVRTRPWPTSLECIETWPTEIIGTQGR